MTMFPLVEQLQELMKSYYTALRYDPSTARDYLANINDIRLQIALTAEVMNIWYEQVNITANSSNFQDTAWFSRNDINYVIRRGIANLINGATLSAVDQGNRQRLVTREPLNWQQLLSQIQFSASGIAAIGQQTLFNFPQELFFQKNETLGLSVENQTSAGNIFYHGADLKESLEKVRRDNIVEEINNYLPEPQLVPILFQFPSATVGTPASNPSGGDEIFSTKNDRSVILTHVSSTAFDCRYTITDEARSQLICEEVEALGIAGNFIDPFEVYYALPYPHLLRQGDRLRLRALNGSLITGNEETADALQFLTFKGFSM